MRKCSALMVLALAATTSATAFARAPQGGILPAMDDPNRPGLGNDMPLRTPDGFARADTFCYGYVQTISGALYAVPNETWTFDHAGGSTEGWYAVDISANSGAFFKRITAAAWGGHTNAVAAPIIGGTASAWVGIYEDQADALCWVAGLGYGNNWCQRWESPSLTFTGNGDINIDFDYFNDTEATFDYSKVGIRLSNGNSFPLNGNGFDDKIGTPSTNTYAHGTLIALASNFEVPSFRVIFEMTSDGGYSDEDGDWATDYGPFGVDNVALSGPGIGATVTYDYESGTQGWTATTCSSVGTFWGIADLSNYTILDPCACRLSGNIMKFHANTGDLGTHTYGQHVQAFSPPVNKAALGSAFNKVIGYFDLYAVMPQANGVFYRPGWNFFPYTCPETGNTQWSGRVGGDSFFYVGTDPVCYTSSDAATDNGVPGDCAQIGMVMEVYASCDAFGIPPTQCTNITNFTPIFDNFEICITGVPNAPVISFDTGGTFQDGYGQGLLLATSNVGNADCVYDVHRDNPTPDLLGDSLVVKGPVTTASTKWEAKMWWRIRREGPGTGVAGYTTWKDAVRDGLNIVGATGQFTFGRMDSLQAGAQIAKNKFISEFREDDDDFAGENTNNNEMIRDGVLPPGTQIQYFITSNYTCTPTQYYYLPDTTGGNLLEFEIMPSWRIDAGTAKFPCILCVDLNTGNQFYVENALNVILNGAGPGAPIPNPTRWDRYDYTDASSNWNAPFARSVGGNNGIGLVQMMGYRQVILYTGTSTSGSMETPDFTLFGDWLSALVCNGNLNGINGRQGFIGNGDELSTLLTSTNPNFLVNYLGANNKCDAYNVDNCGPTTPADESFCVRVNAAGGAQFGTQINYDLFGNWCPQKYTFDVLTAVGGIGNRVYNDYDRVPPTNGVRAGREVGHQQWYRQLSRGARWLLLQPHVGA
ncbi:MAG: hypothetical protein U0527_01655 [Candidatus Eisenbacteria bacterium]